jgi:hypothetical protein
MGSRGARLLTSLMLYSWCRQLTLVLTSYEHPTVARTNKLILFEHTAMTTKHARHAGQDVNTQQEEEEENPLPKTTPGG